MSELYTTTEKILSFGKLFYSDDIFKSLSTYICGYCDINVVRFIKYLESVVHQITLFEYESDPDKFDTQYLDEVIAYLKYLHPWLDCKKAKNALNKLLRRTTCSKYGRVAVGYDENGNIDHLRYFPVRCHSVFCRFCSFYESRERLERLYEHLKYFLERQEPVYFITFTTKNVEGSALSRAIDDLLKSFSKFINFRLSEKRLEQLKDLALNELDKYIENIEDLHLKRKKRKFHIRLIYKFIEFVKAKLKETGKKSFKLRDLYIGITRKIEITYNNDTSTFHPHIHVLVVGGQLPKFIILAILRLMKNHNFGEVLDVRGLGRHKKDLLEVAKYVNKSAVSEPDYPLIDQFWVEYALYGRKRLTFIGFKDIDLNSEIQKREQEDGYTNKEIMYELYSSFFEVNLISTYGLPSIIRKCRKDKSMEIVGQIRFLTDGREYPIYVDGFGRFIIPRNAYEDFEKVVFNRNCYRVAEFKKTILVPESDYCNALH